MANYSLSATEQVAIDFLRQNGGCVLITQVPEKNELDVFGETVPGLTVFKKLEKKGLVFFTKEEPIEFADGLVFDFTPLIYLKEE